MCASCGEHRVPRDVDEFELVRERDRAVREEFSNETRARAANMWRWRHAACRLFTSYSNIELYKTSVAIDRWSPSCFGFILQVNNNYIYLKISIPKRLIKPKFTYLRLDRLLVTISQFKSPRKLIERAREELTAQVYFIIGLVLCYGAPWTNNNNNNTQRLADNRLASLMCFVKSSLISKPKNFSVEKSSVCVDNEPLMRLVYRDSALRYSIIGNWIMFVVGKYFDEDQIELVEQLCSFASNTDVRSAFFRLRLLQNSFNKLEI